MIKVDLTIAEKFISKISFDQIWEKCAHAHGRLVEGNGPGCEYLGWVKLPADFDREELVRIKAAADKIRKNSDVLVVVGIGGSYLGTRAALELLQGQNHNSTRRDRPEIYFAGNSLSSCAWNELKLLIGERDFSINVVSKSGTTTEPAVVYRLLRELAQQRYGSLAKDRIYATTDKVSGALAAMAADEGYESFSIPSNIGGRYSVLTAVGLLPLAVAGVDIEALMAGACEAMTALMHGTPENPAWKYAAARNLFYGQGKKIELLAIYEPGARFFCEWFKQLFGESEGKQGKGIFPASVEFTADLHSLGQYLQDGERHIFETLLDFGVSADNAYVPYDEKNADGLNYLSGKSLDFIRAQAFLAATKAHADGGVPSIIIEAPDISASSIGGLIYFFEFSCGISAYMLGVNPFDQPGVEEYKREMFHRLGKPGFCK